jgi:hypothetical protein
MGMNLQMMWLLVPLFLFTVTLAGISLTARFRPSASRAVRRLTGAPKIRPRG